MNLYNTLTKQIEDFKPNTDEVKIYTCGPTVYEKSHIGHWYTYIRNDILVRLLKFDYKKVKWVVNITDVGHLTSDADEGEDKLQKSANIKKQSAWDIAKFYTSDFMKGINKLNITMPDVMPKATDHIDEQIALIKKLEKLGYTYRIDDGIYFDTSKFTKYKDFAQLDLDEQLSSVRVELNKNKKNPSDFALWKFSPINSKRDMEWESPWGIGFPGWHIECSAMSMKYLGENFDIHSGGIDHIPVHHTNEIAQSMAVTGKMPANYWFHSNHVMINNQKISKSLDNGYTLDQLEDLGFSSEVIRLHVLESSYRNQANFQLDDLLAAKNRYNSWLKVAALSYQLSKNIKDIEYIDTYKTIILNDLRNDLNTPKALSDIDSIFNYITNNRSTVNDKQVKDLILFIDSLLGTRLSELPNISEDIQDMILKRDRLKEAKSWEDSDELRRQIYSKGVGLDDTETRSYWYYLEKSSLL